MGKICGFSSIFSMEFPLFLRSFWCKSAKKHYLRKQKGRILYQRGYTCLHEKRTVDFDTHRFHWRHIRKGSLNGQCGNRLEKLWTWLLIPAVWCCQRLGDMNVIFDLQVFFSSGEAEWLDLRASEEVREHRGPGVWAWTGLQLSRGKTRWQD